jgi:hypothetical protein
MALSVFPLVCFILEGGTELRDPPLSIPLLLCARAGLSFGIAQAFDNQSIIHAHHIDAAYRVQFSCTPGHAHENDCSLVRDQHLFDRKVSGRICGQALPSRKTGCTTYYSGAIRGRWRAKSIVSRRSSGRYTDERSFPSSLVASS